MSERIPTACVLPIAGDMDLSQAPRLTLLEADLASESCVVVDASGLKFCDTTFLRFLMHLKAQPNKTERHGVRLAAPSATLERILRVTGLHKMFPRYPSVGSAIADVGTVHQWEAVAV
jgi:anti-anti-sigma factor